MSYELRKLFDPTYYTLYIHGRSSDRSNTPPHILLHNIRICVGLHFVLHLEETNDYFVMNSK